MTVLDDELDELLEQARRCSKLGGGSDPDEVIAAIRVYLDNFAGWQEKAQEAASGKLSPERQAHVRARIQELERCHAQVVKLAEASKQQIADELSDLHRRKKALRTYLDRFPSRISITGKRKG